MWDTELTETEAITKDLTNAAAKLSRREIRYLVDSFYQMQDNRIRARAQAKALDESGEPHEIINWLDRCNTRLEKHLAKAMKAYVQSSPVGQWMLGIHGIGPVLAAGFMAHIDITRAPSYGHIYSFAGLVCGQKWKKGEKRPWNAELKRLCWLAGECFVKVSWKKDSFYGQEYLRRKALERQHNLEGKFKEAADAMIKAVPSHAQRKTYEQGILPDSHIHERAKRYVVKLFISHLHTVMYRDHYKKDPPLPYPIAHMDHVDYIDVPAA